MELSRHLLAIQGDLVAAAALVGEDAAEVGRRLSAAVEPSLQLRLLDVVTDVSLALNSQLASGHVEVRLAGRDPELVLVDDESGREAAPPAPGDDTSARITLRLPEALKLQIEAAASLEGVSTNAWIVRSLARSLEPRATRTRAGNRLWGFAQS